MSEKKEHLLLTNEFAARMGVTVRTLHHYDRIGLLKPGRRSGAGYRLYGAAEAARLQQILTLKFIGFPLNRIRELLDRVTLNLPATLRMQRKLLETERARMARALDAITRCERSLTETGVLDWAALKSITEVMTMSENNNWLQYYDEDARAKLEAREWTPEMQADISKRWADLFRDIEAAQGCDPAGETAQALLARWGALVGEFTQGDAGIERGLKNFYADQENWGGRFQKPWSDEVGAFIQAARAAKK
jgi:DNA-binding transcriptional MerR regulator